MFVGQEYPRNNEKDAEEIRANTEPTPKIRFPLETLRDDERFTHYRGHRQNNRAHGDSARFLEIHHGDQLQNGLGQRLQKRLQYEAAVFIELFYGEFRILRHAVAETDIDLFVYSDVIS